MPADTCTLRRITSDATRVARCARGSSQTGAASSGSRPVAPGQLEPKVPGMSHETRAGLEEPLLQARQGPALDGDRQGEPAHESGQGVAADPGQQADPISPEEVVGCDRCA